MNSFRGNPILSKICLQILKMKIVLKLRYPIIPEIQTPYRIYVKLYILCSFEIASINISKLNGYFFSNKILFVWRNYYLFTLEKGKGINEIKEILQ